MPDFFLPSLLDRLGTDFANRNSHRLLKGFAAAEYRKMVIRDLQRLLNHSSFFVKSGGGEGNGAASAALFPRVAESVLNYGVDLCSGSTISGATIEQLRRNLLEAIECFEPRLRRIRVEVPKASEKDTEEQKLDPGKLLFVVEADLVMEPFPENLRLLTELDLVSGECSISDNTNHFPNVG